MFNKPILTNDQINVLNIRSGSIGIQNVNSNAQTAQDAIVKN